MNVIPLGFRYVTAEKTDMIFIELVAKVFVLLYNTVFQIFPSIFYNF